MKVLLITDSSNPHSRKWASFLKEAGVEVEVLSLIDAPIDGTKVHTFRSQAYAKRKSNIEYDRFGVLREVLPQVKALVRKIKPDIVHSHYVSSFGLFGAFSGFHPFVVSAWGSDITDFPSKSRINRYIVQQVLKKADVICSSSEYLAAQVSRFTSKKQEIIYFGTDFEQFKPLRDSDTVLRSHFPFLDNALDRHKTFVFGTVKSLYPHYGINYLLQAAALFSQTVASSANKHNRYQPDWELWIGGDGDCREELEQLAVSLNIAGKVKFLGRVEHSELPLLLNRMDAFIVPSLRESFGVAAVEASACELPLIVSKTGGLPEIVVEQETGFCVEPASPQAIADKMLLLYEDRELAKTLGKAGRRFTMQRFSKQENTRKMIDIYERLMSRLKTK